MYTVTNGQVSAMLAGAAADQTQLLYLSIIGTQAEVKSIKAGIVTAKYISVPGMRSVNHKRAEPWRDFSKPLENSAFHHYVWMADSPLLVIAPDRMGAGLMKSSANLDPALQQHVQNKARTELAPRALLNNLNKTSLPIEAAWAQLLFERSLHLGYLTPVRYSGDCIYAATRTSDMDRWRALISQMVRQGELQ